MIIPTHAGREDDRVRLEVAENGEVVEFEYDSAREEAQCEEDSEEAEGRSGEDPEDDDGAGDEEATVGTDSPHEVLAEEARTTLVKMMDMDFLR